MTPPTLFLHAGPGLNAHVERQVLGDRLPHVHFWDQPPVRRQEGAFAQLVEAATLEVERLATGNGGQVDLLAHSFAGHLASALLERVPDRIGTCRLVSVVHDVPSGYLNLLRRMARDPDTDGELRDAIAGFLAGHAEPLGVPERVWDYFRFITRDPEVLRHYWPMSRQYLRYRELAGAGPAWDVETFEHVLNDFLSDYGKVPQPVSDRPVQIELGGRDPLLSLEHETALWRARFPHADIHIRPAAGHFIHLEADL